jgi:hypothetical protein
MPKLGMQHNEKRKRSVLTQTREKVTIKRREKGLRSSIKMDFMRLRTASYLAQMNVYLSQISKERHMTSDVFGLSNTKHLHRNAVLHCE